MAHLPPIDPRLGMRAKLPVIKGAIEVTRAVSGPAPASPLGASNSALEDAQELLLRHGYKVVCF